jgi:5-methylcytosine-specific restriction endonuclease McrA
MLWTLELNSTYEPVLLLRWSDAVTKWSKGSVEIIESYDKPLRSKYLNMQVPSVVRLKTNYHRHNFHVPLDKWRLFARDGWKCQYCGKTFRADRLNIDHVKPKAQSGKHLWKNVVTSCEPCNQRKGARTPAEAGMPLLRRPKQPRWMPWLIIKKVRLAEVPESWVQWIDWMAADPDIPELCLEAAGVISA